MESVCGGIKPFLPTALLDAEHQRCMDSAIHHFQNKRKMGGDEFSQMYMEKLMKVLINMCYYNSLQRDQDVIKNLS